MLWVSRVVGIVIKKQIENSFLYSFSCYNNFLSIYLEQKIDKNGGEKSAGTKYRAGLYTYSENRPFPLKKINILHIFPSKITYILCNICYLYNFLKNIYSFYVDRSIGDKIQNIDY